MKRIGLFAGAFDPIHDGHIDVAKEAVRILDLDRLAFMVEKCPRGSKTPVNLVDRQAMVDLAINSEEKLFRIDLDDKSFTIDSTLGFLEDKFPEDKLFFIFGADVFMNMNYQQWPGLDRLTKHYLVVFERGIYGEEKIAQHAKELGQAIAILPSPHPKHSSTDVRFSSDKHLWLPVKVAEYITTHELYLG